jgi:hypothetical protein
VKAFLKCTISSVYPAQPHPTALSNLVRAHCLALPEIPLQLTLRKVILPPVQEPMSGTRGSGVPTIQDMEVLFRQQDGSVIPVSGQRFAAYRKKNAAIVDFFEKAFEKGTDTDRAMELMEEAQRKIQTAEKEMTDGRKLAGHDEGSDFRERASRCE